MIAILLGLAAALAWGSADFAARFSGRAMGPAAALLTVTATGAVMVSLWLAATGHPLPAAASPAALLYGTLSVVGTLALYEALRRAPIAVVAPLAGAFPAWTLAYMVIFDGLRPEPLAWVAMALVMAGVWLVARYAAADAQGQPAAPVAIALALTAGALFGLTLVAGLHATQTHGQAQALWLARVIGLLLMLPLTLALALRRRRPVPPPRWLAIAAGQGILDTLAFVAILAVRGEEDAAIAGVVSSTFGIVTIALARIFLREPVTRPQWLGIAATFAGVAMLSALE
jgi:drug/metabolite transporter (DMT)-like permease